MIFVAGNSSQRSSFTGASDAFAAFNQEQGSMSRAVNQARAGVQKLVWLPFQWHATMRAAVVIDEHLPVASGGEQFATIDFKPAALGFRQLITGAEQFHHGLRWACDVVSQAANCGSSFWDWGYL